MNSRLEIFYSTSNFKKFEFLKMITQNQKGILMNWLDSKASKIDETNDAKSNAQNKAKVASKLHNGLILSSDDSITFLDTELSNKSGASIYRNISIDRNSTEITKYYIDLIKKSNNKTVNTKLTSFFSFSKNGRTMKSFEYSYNMILRIPVQINYLDDMPLSMLHFIPEKNKFYFELTTVEQIEFHKTLLTIFNSIIRDKKIIAYKNE